MKFEDWLKSRIEAGLPVDPESAWKAGYSAGLERAAEIAAKLAQARRSSADIAMSMGRENVSSHMESDADTCDDIADSIRAEMGGAS